tara:strand:- start:1126 stop:1623 length:498 start_codon:yes stop_codon:yes gene_type:complete
MKKFLLLSVLILFSCSKDRIVPANSGDKIIGNYQLVQKLSNEQAEYSHWDTRTESPSSLLDVQTASEFISTNVTGKISFNSDFKGHFDIIVDDTKNIKLNFDWSYEGGKWYLIDENSEQWQIKNTDRCVSETIYCSSQANTGSLYVMEKNAGYRTGDWRSYKLVF